MISALSGFARLPLRHKQRTSDPEITLLGGSCFSQESVEEYSQTIFWEVEICLIHAFSDCSCTYTTYPAMEMTVLGSLQIKGVIPGRRL